MTTYNQIPTDYTVLMVLNGVVIVYYNLGITSRVYRIYEIRYGLLSTSYSVSISITVQTADYISGIFQF